MTTEHDHGAQVTLAGRFLDRCEVARTIGLPEAGGPQRFNLRNGAPFASGYQRVVYGDRGPYVEFRREDIVVPLRCTRHREALWQSSDALPPEDCGFYYLWLVPVGDERATKVYWQIKPVAYADYRRGLYYVSPWDLDAVGCSPSPSLLDRLLGTTP